MWTWGILVAGIAGVAWFFRWALRWRDPNWDTQEGQAKSKLWSKLNLGRR